MSDLLRVILDSLQFLWPFRLVKQDERGGYYFCGRFLWEVGPGWPWPVIPWFMDVRAYSNVPAILSTRRLDITLKDGSMLTFVGSATVQMVDFNLAINTVDSYTQTTQELLEAVLADKLAAVDRERLEPEKRGRLMADLTRWINEESGGYGIQVTKVRFTTFVHNVRTYRLLQEQSPEMW